ncbi:MAG: ImmA/IrrE family metallo-endopeptidase [Oligoflexales bacterium]
MKKVEANRYPHSATLFKFCKEALELRYDGNVKVIDQDVGAILGYDPADCSHWKKGKKNIRSLNTLRSIADHLNIDERLLIDIASGKISLEEAVFEFKGYGAFALQGKHLENLKKEFFKNPLRWQKEDSMASFEELFDLNRPEVVKIAQYVMDAGTFEQAPIYIPELYQLFNNIQLVAVNDFEKPVVVERVGTGTEQVTTVQYRSGEMRPYMRFLLAKELYKHLCTSGHSACVKFIAAPEEVLDIQANIFAGLILVPTKLLRKEVEKLDSSMDIVSQLADTFWTSKALMNQRLRDYLQYFC